MGWIVVNGRDEEEGRTSRMDGWIAWQSEEDWTVRGLMRISFAIFIYYLQVVLIYRDLRTAHSGGGNVYMKFGTGAATGFEYQLLVATYP